MMSTLDEALIIRDKDVELIDWCFHEVMGVYCRFGSLPISLKQLDYYGCLYMTDVVSVQASVSGPLTIKMPAPSFRSVVRVPVGFEILPGKFPGYEFLARVMHMSSEKVQDAYEHVMRHGQGRCTAEWSTNSAI